MKFTNLLFTLLAITTVFAFTNPTSNLHEVDTAKSTIAWKGYKVTGEHAGTIDVKSGSLDIQEGVLKGGSFEIDMTSIACTDLEGEYAGKLVGHLASPDFFNVAEFPTASFKITKAIAYAGGDHKVTGNLTIKDKTEEISFRANVTDGIATAKIVIDRSKFDIRYGSGSFFDNLGDKTIYDEFDLDISLATK